MIDKKQLESVLEKTKNQLLENLNDAGHWEGKLSSSALATAVAVFALSQTDAQKYSEIIISGLTWLAENANFDGGWGDSPESKSNLSTTLLCWSAFTSPVSPEGKFESTLRNTERWITERAGSLESAKIAKAVLEFYGNDKTFSAPILTLCALAGRLGSAPDCWKLVPQLPLELAALPHQLFRWARLPVVSYAIPALIAIGLVRHKLASNSFSLPRLIRNLVLNKTLAKLTSIQPSNGGYLEATPLTSFVCMSLSSAGLKEHQVVKKGVVFILKSQRKDGSWPIDTNLATWLTTLSVNALAAGSGLNKLFSESQKLKLAEWLVKQQFTEEHVFTHAAPGGWSWTNLPGAVPDADDTSGALVALHNLAPRNENVKQAAQRGVQWLLDLQNKDGGIPTFCRGWGKLPFDRSCPDITAHALHAFSVWQSAFSSEMNNKIKAAITHGLTYLKNSQREDGTWLPLWFGNQNVPGEKNPTYGTSRVLNALQQEGLVNSDFAKEMTRKGVEWLSQAQNQDGSWGSNNDIDPTVEETALALTVLARNDDAYGISKGFMWLSDRVESGEIQKPAPIGLYFASLWYSEKLYPLLFAVGALECVSNQTEK